ncbi:hypothetical protein H2C98_01950 [Vibrio parahaemolyticus]|uniref:hypothetical protein n=1 Tax=Vibrio parahaemolyticus TaxID=670 RepID=UPI00211A7D09|nr:hypothetical protein [Vibrio parahaemolyticus]MCQ9040238.1 hypothetical protein [Vibrio parahaemolyticus]
MNVNQPEQPQLNESELAALEAAKGADIELADGTKLDTGAEQEAELDGQALDAEHDKQVEAEAEQPEAEQPEATDNEDEDDEKAALKARIAELEYAQTEATIFGMVGGKEQYMAMTKWAETGLPQAEVDMFNAVMDSGNVAQMQFAVRALEAIYKSQVGHEGVRLGGKASDSEAYSYESDEDFYADLQNPLYKEDSPAGEAFRQKVMLKMTRMTTQSTSDGWVHA